MRFLKILLITAILVLVIFIFVESNVISQETETIPTDQSLKQKESKLETKSMKNGSSQNSVSEVYHWIGKSTEVLTEQFGEPNRKDVSAYGYTWWIYNENYKEYYQFGVANGEVVTLFTTGNDVTFGDLYIGQSYEEIKDAFDVRNEITYNEGLGSFTFQLTEEDLQSRPLVKVGNGVFMQLYVDSFTEQLSSIRVLNGETLLKHRPYEIVYRGILPEEISFSEEEWKDVEAGMEQQIFDLTNVYREMHGKDFLEWDESVSNVAFQHSKDMAENNYFSHYALNGDGLKERLAKEEVYYIAAGENIAAQYTDAIAAMEGWLNSEGHRVALISDEYTHIGVGVYRLYYTQNFLAKAE